MQLVNWKSINHNIIDDVQYLNLFIIEYGIVILSASRSSILFVCSELKPFKLIVFQPL